MEKTVAEMTQHELWEMLNSVIDQKADEDPGRRQALRERLLRQKEEVAASERGWHFEDVVSELGMS